VDRLLPVGAHLLHAVDGVHLPQAVEHAGRAQGQRRHGQEQGRDGGGTGQEQPAEPFRPSRARQHDRQGHGEADQGRRVLGGARETGHRTGQEGVAPRVVARADPLGEEEGGEDEEDRDRVDVDDRAPHHQGGDEGGEPGREETGRGSGEPVDEEAGEEDDAEREGEGDQAADDDQVRRLQDVVVLRRRGREVVEEGLAVDVGVDRRPGEGGAGDEVEGEGGISVGVRLPGVMPEQIGDVMEDVPFVDVAHVGQPRGEGGEPHEGGDGEDREPRQQGRPALHEYLHDTRRLQDSPARVKIGAT
jgi:hypothetical protein